MRRESIESVGRTIDYGYHARVKTFTFLNIYFFTYVHFWQMIGQRIRINHRNAKTQNTLLHDYFFKDSQHFKTIGCQ